MKIKFKIGDAVRIKDKYSSFNGVAGVIMFIDTRGRDSILVKFNSVTCAEFFHSGDLELVPKILDDINTLAVGDVLVDDDNNEITIFGLIERAALLSWSNFDKGWFTLEEIRKQGFKLKNLSEGNLEITLDAATKILSDKFGTDVKIIKNINK